MSQNGSHIPSSGILPWSHSCFVCGERNPCGLKLRSRIEDGRVVLEHVLREEDQGWQGIAHGGITATLLDEVMTWAAILEARKACVAAEFTIRLRQPVRVGEAVRAEGWSSGGKARLLRTEARLLTSSGEEAAVASGKYMPMPGDAVRDCAPGFIRSSDSIPIERVFGAAEQEGSEK